MRMIAGERFRASLPKEILKEMDELFEKYMEDADENDEGNWDEFVEENASEHYKKWSAERERRYWENLKKGIIED